jgi:opacity protein-like surface antigen
MTTIRSIVLMSLLTTAGVMSAKAADLDYPVFQGEPAAHSQMMEFGTGWYLRGDIAAAREKRPKLDSALSFPTAAAVSQNNWSVSLGAGYQFTNMFRSDMTFDYRHTAKASGAAAKVVCPYAPATLTDQTTNLPVGVLYNPNDTCTPRQEASLATYDVMLNGYVDLGNWSGLTPYVGAGAGISSILSRGAVNYIKDSDNTPYAADLTITGVPAIWKDAGGTTLNPQPNIAFTKQNWDKASRSRDWNLAWALMAGVAYDINKNAKFDIGYRYLNLGSYTTTSLAGVSKTTSFTAHEVRAGIRYMID